MKTIRDEYLIAILTTIADQTEASAVVSFAQEVAAAACSSWGHIPEYSHERSAYNCARCGGQVEPK